MDYKLKIIKEDDNDYPKRLLELKKHPKQLYALGDTSLLNKDSVAVVGSRNCDNYGREETERFAGFLAKKGICIVSGLAVGIDTVAHTTSMNEVGKTIAVVASGFEHIYPKQNEKLFHQIVENGGCIISEYPPETEVDMGKFPKRNILISAISIATLIVEATLRCGSTITGRETMKQDKPLFCVPGDVSAILSGGTNQLILEGAYLVTTPYDILDTLEFEGYNYENAITVKENCQEVFKVITAGPKTVDDLTEETGLDIVDINEILLILEMDDWIKNEDGKYAVKPNYLRDRRKKKSAT